MAQILRVYKPDVVMVARCYGTQRGQRNYYEVLNVPPSASQKDIRHAFLALSKKMHPDVCGKDGHAEFVKINEAYTVLSKADSRRQYDFDLRHCHSYTHRSSSYQQYRRPTETYRHRREWEESMAGRYYSSPYPNSLLNGRNNALLIVLLLSIGVAVQVLSFKRSMRMREQMILQSQQYEREIEEIRRKAENRTPEEEAEFIRELQEAAIRRAARARELRNTW